jgi:uncharacterized protein (DUF305 family)
MRKLALFILAALLSGCATGDSSNTSFSADDQMFAAMMIPHHEQAIQMADMVIDSANEEAALLGKAIVESQSAEIERMRQLLTR